jgi:5,5'-dehydrodivanillate O-demethylase
MEQTTSNDFAHVGPTTLTGRYLRTFWHPVCVAASLAPDSAKPIKFAGEQFTLYRGKSGVPHVLDFRCAHRGTQLSAGWVEDDCIRCRYHGWKYDASGQCVETPGQTESFAGKIRIRSYPAQEYLGLIFAYFGDGNPPALPKYADFESEGVIVATTYTRACNYFNNVENSVDLLHVAFTHGNVSNYRSLGISSIAARESDWGITVSATAPDGRVRLNQFGMPNIINFKTPPEVPAPEWTDVLAWRVPLDDETHASFSAKLVHVSGEAAERLLEMHRAKPAKTDGTILADLVLKGEMSLEEISESEDLHQGKSLIDIQDHVVQIGQGAIADREHERLGPTDVGIILLRKLYFREIQSFARSTPLKQWVRGERLKATL